MAAKKLTKYEQMWKTRRRNAKLRKEAASAEAREVGTAMKPDGRTREARALKATTATTRRSAPKTTRSRAGLKARNPQTLGELIAWRAGKNHVPRIFHEDPVEPFTIVMLRDVEGDLVRVSLHEILRTADAIRKGNIG